MSDIDWSNAVDRTRWQQRAHIVESIRNRAELGNDVVLYMWANRAMVWLSTPNRDNPDTMPMIATAQHRTSIPHKVEIYISHLFDT